MDVNKSTIPGVLLLYYRPLLNRSAATVREHIAAFAKHSRYRVWSVNTDLGFPRALETLHFAVVVLHYSLFGQGSVYMLNRKFEQYIQACKGSRKIAFFQDEYRYCQKRFSFVIDYGIDTVYTLVEPDYFDLAYRKYIRVRTLVHTLAGYVSEELIEAARRFARPAEERTIDIGYRGRELPFYVGRGGQEKHQIAIEFLKRVSGLPLQLDIATDEKRRYYGAEWYRFLGNCRGCLGVEAGVSVFDAEDKARPLCEVYLRDHPSAGFDQVFERVLRPFENLVPYRTISPRHFEAAAFRACQILFEGHYSGLLEPMVHYLPLKKDFSNLSEVITLFRDPEIRNCLTENAYRDLIASGAYSYKGFIETFDKHLSDLTLELGSIARNHPLWQKLRVNSLQRLKALVREVRRWVYRALKE